MSVLVQIRDVPDDVHRRLKARAALAGRSLSDYLREELARSAARPTPAELQERLASLTPAATDRSPADLVRELREHGET